jgi:hypothetical protein
MSRDINELKRKAEALQKKIHQAEARRDGILEQLHNEFNLTGEKAARKHLRKLKLQTEEKENEFKLALRNFVKTYGEFIDRDD